MGLLRPGQRLYFGEKGEETARVRADGLLEYNGERGSIHQIAKKILGAPANGWDQWYYQEKSSSTRFPIDRLRQVIRDAQAEDQE